MWVGNAVKSSVKVLAEMKCAIQEAAEMTCAMEVKTQVKSTLNENHQWPMKAATKIKIHGGCSNCNEIYNVSIAWNEWKTATKKWNLNLKAVIICIVKSVMGVATRTKSSSSSK